MNKNDQQDEIKKLQQKVAELEKQLSERKDSSSDLWKATFNAVDSSVCILDVNATILECNRKTCELLEKTASQIIGKKCWEIFHGSNRPVTECVINRMKISKCRESVEIQSRDRWYYETVDPILDSENNIIKVIHTIDDITDRKRMDEVRELSLQFLDIACRHTSLDKMLQECIEKLKKYTRCGAVGFRLLDSQGNIPYSAYAGFSTEFYEKESPLSIKSDVCMCIKVIKGDIDAKLEYFTPGGSFFMNATTVFLKTLSEEEKGKTRNVCNHYGYESVALIPIKIEEKIIGLIHIADKAENRIPLEMVTLLEYLAKELGPGIERLISHKALQDSEERFHKIIKNTNVGYFFIDQNGRFQNVNDAWLKMHKFSSSEEIIGQHFSATQIDTDLQSAQRNVERLLSGEPVPGSEFTRRNRDGSIGYHMFSAHPVEREGKIIGLEGFLIDTTEKTQNEIELNKNRQLIEKTFTSLIDAIFIIDATSTEIIDCNPAASVLFGYKREEMLGRTVDFLHANDASLQDFRDYLYPAVEKNGFFSMREFRMKRKNGAIFPTEHHVLPLENEQGFRIGWVSVVRDKTEQKLAEKALRESEEKFRLVAETIDDVFWICTPGVMEMLYVSPAYEKIWGRTVKSLFKKPLSFMDSIIQEDRKRFTEFIKKYHAKAIPYSCEYRIMGKNKSIRWILERGFPVKREDGECKYMTGVCRDITESKRIEEELINSEELLHQTFASLNDAVFLIDPVTRVITACNPAVERIFGYSKEEVIGRNTEFLHVSAEKYSHYGEMLFPALERDGVFYTEFKVRHKNGNIFYSEHTVNDVRNNSNERIALVSLVRDISERKELEQKLKENQNLLKDSKSELEEFSRTILTIREEEKKKISSALHDELGSMSISLNAILTALLDHIQNNKTEAALEDINVGRKILLNSIDRFKNIIIDLRPPDLEIIGLAGALREHFSAITAQNEIIISLKENIKNIKIDDKISIALFRIVQEALNNTIFHANASRFDVNIKHKNRNIELIIRDNGKGFDVNERCEFGRNSIGIVGMREMVEANSGTFDIKSSSEQGTEIRVILPMFKKRKK